MNNLELHNRLLQLAKDVEELRVKHPELAGDIIRLETHLAETPTGAPHPTPIPYPYHKAY